MSPETHLKPSADDQTAGVASFVRGSNQSGMRASNERLVLTIIREAGPLPKAAIARMTGLSAQTVSVIMRALEEDGLLVKGAPVRGKVGQPSIPMGLAQDGAYFLGLKVGRRGSELVLIDFLGKIRTHRRTTHRVPTPYSTVAFANAYIRAFLDALPQAHQDRVAGLGIALPFRMWDWSDGSTTDHAELDAWRSRDIAAEIGTSWKFPIYLCNDATAACGAELVFGAQTGLRDFLYVYIGYFVGGGLVLDNRLYTGTTDNAAALGSVPVMAADGRPCQLVELASLVTLERMLDRAGHDSGAISDRAGEWNVPAGVLSAWLDQAADGLAQAIIAATCVIDCKTVLIDGSLPETVRAELVARTTAALARRTTPGVERPEIAAGSISYTAKALGAASLPLSDRFLVERDALLKV